MILLSGSGTPQLRKRENGVPGDNCRRALGSRRRPVLRILILWTLVEPRTNEDFERG
jgi:hypothetical protein